MGLIFLYRLIGFFFGFNLTMDYLNDQRKKRTNSYVVIFFVSIIVVFPFGFILWPFIFMRALYNGLRN